MPTATYHIYSPHTPEQLVEVLSDFQSYPKFLPQVAEIFVRLNEPPIWEVRFVLNLIRRLEYELRLELKAEESSTVSGEYDQISLSWSLLEGVFKSNTGFWNLRRLTPKEALEVGLSSGTEIDYSISMQLDTYLPKSIFRSLSNHSMPTIVNHVLEETERRFPLSES